MCRSFFLTKTFIYLLAVPEKCQVAGISSQDDVMWMCNPFLLPACPLVEVPVGGAGVQWGQHLSPVWAYWSVHCEVFLSYAWSKSAVEHEGRSNFNLPFWQVLSASYRAGVMVSLIYSEQHQTAKVPRVQHAKIMWFFPPSVYELPLDYGLSPRCSKSPLLSVEKRCDTKTCFPFVGFNKALVLFSVVGFCWFFLGVFVVGVFFPINRISFWNSGFTC